ncbi:MAG: AarF/ABC1/UbiB kinase family protein [Acidimicrobiia bacterium]|nr:AarF/ABC1/UbiB kinase family protein [Acidimicrobiia bacterium]
MSAAREPAASVLTEAARDDGDLSRLDRFGPQDVARLCQVGVALSRAAAVEVVRRNAKIPASPRRHAPRAAASTMRRAFEDLGPAYIKLGQVIASSPGLFPGFLSYEFRRCLDRVPPEPEHVVRRRVAGELGAAPDRIFEEFSYEPLASASIAQVHAARFEGRDVVVKIRRPGLVRRFRHDLRLLYQVAGLLERAGGAFDFFGPVAIVEEFARTLYEELDFLREAEAMRQFEANLRAYGDNSHVRVPEVVDALTTERVLTMERIYGVPPDDDATILGEWGLDARDLFRNAIRAWLEAAFVHGLFHGDVHAGNLVIGPDATVTFLDFGIMGRVDEETLRLVREVLPAVGMTQDWDRAARLVATLAGDTDATEAEVALFAADLERVVGRFISTELREVSYAAVLDEVLGVARRTGYAVPRELTLVAKQFLYFERYAKLLAPDYAPFEDEALFATLLAIVSHDSGHDRGHDRGTGSPS